MKRVPSERLFFNRKELPVFTSGLSILVERADGAAIGSFNFRRHAWPPQFNDGIYADQAEDPRFVELLRRLLAKLSKHPYGRFRLNVQELTALAFALRVARSVSMLPALTWRTLESRIERARRRRLYAAVRKFGKAMFVSYREHWLRFVHWCRFNLLYDWHFVALRAKHATLRSAHRAELDEFRIWVGQMIADRCEAPISEEKLTWIARETKRRARRRRFGASVGEVLQDKPGFSDAIFKYLEGRLALTVKFEAKPFIQQKMIRWAQIGRTLAQPRSTAASTPPSTTVQQPHASSVTAAQVTALPTPAIPVKAVEAKLPAASTQAVSPRAELVKLVAEFFTVKIDPSYWDFLAKETIRQAAGYQPPPRIKLRFPLSLLVKYGELPDGYDKQLYEEIDWLLYHLSRFADTSEIAGIVADGLREASHSLESSPAGVAV